MAGRKPPWSDLPQELLSAIANSLPTDQVSIITFRSVCRSWRSSCPPLLNSPILSTLLPLSIPLHSNSYHFALDSSDCSFVSVTVIYALYRPIQSPGIESSLLSPDAWILFVDEFIPGKLSIRKPFFTDSYFTPINFPNINLNDFNVRELGRFHNLSYSVDSGFYGYQCLFTYKLGKPRFCLTQGVNKVVMFPNAPAAITLRTDGTLGTYRLNVGINEEISNCQTKHNGKGFRFDDIVEYNGRVLGIDRRTRVYQINYHFSELIPFVAPIVGGGGRRKRLVESLGLLYLVVRCKEELGKSHKRPKFKVYVLNEGRKKWCEITSLGDRSFLFGVTFSFSASAQELGTCVKNCILFVKKCFPTYSGYDDDYNGLSQLKNCELDIKVWHLDDADHFGAIESYPAYSDSLWPAPIWIWSFDRLVRFGKVEFAIGKMLDKVYEKLKTLEEREISGDYSDIFGHRVLEAARSVLSLKKMVVRYHQEEESEFMHDDRESMDIFNKGFMLILQKVYNLFEQPGTWSNWTTEEELGCPDSFKKTSQPCHDSHLCSTTSMLRKRHAFLFHIEEQVTEVEMLLKTLLAPVPLQ